MPEYFCRVSRAWVPVVRLCDGGVHAESRNAPVVFGVYKRGGTPRELFFTVWWESGCVVYVAGAHNVHVSSPSSGSVSCTVNLWHDMAGGSLCMCTNEQDTPQARDFACFAHAIEREQAELLKDATRS